MRVVPLQAEVVSLESSEYWEKSGRKMSNPRPGPEVVSVSPPPTPLHSHTALHPRRSKRSSEHES